MVDPGRNRNFLLDASPYWTHSFTCGEQSKLRLQVTIMMDIK